MHIPSFLCLLIICSRFVPHSGDDTPRPVFIFGDSTADVGTNNFLAQSNATANFPQYGVDFPHQRPTGRFSNGLNSADALGNILYTTIVFHLLTSAANIGCLRLMVSHTFRVEEKPPALSVSTDSKLSSIPQASVQRSEFRLRGLWTSGRNGVESGKPVIRTNTI